MKNITIRDIGRAVVFKTFDGASCSGTIRAMLDSRHVVIEAAVTQPNGSRRVVLPKPAWKDVTPFEPGSKFLVLES